MKIHTAYSMVTAVAACALVLHAAWAGLDVGAARRDVERRRQARRRASGALVDLLA